MIEHDLGECEEMEGYLCDQCRQEYMERMDDMALSKDDVGWEKEYSETT
jgi:hypothetical protein